MLGFGKKEDTALIERVRVLGIQRGDIIVVTLAERHCTKERMERVRDLFTSAFGNLPGKVIVLPKGMTMEHIRPSEPPPVTVAGVSVDEMNRQAMAALAPMDDIH